MGVNINYKNRTNFVRVTCAMMTATVSFGIGHSRFSMSSLRPEGLTPEDHCALLADETRIFVEGTMKAKTQEDGKNKTSNLGIIE